MLIQRRREEEKEVDPETTRTTSVIYLIVSQLRTRSRPHLLPWSSESQSIQWSTSSTCNPRQSIYMPSRVSIGRAACTQQVTPCK